MTTRIFPAHVESPSGLSVQVNANGSVRRMDHGDIILNLFLGTEIEGGPANVYLRRHDASIESIPLHSPSCGWTRRHVAGHARDTKASICRTGAACRRVPTAR